GRYPSDMVELYERCFGALDAVADGDLELIARPLDFLGVNYYEPKRVRSAPGVAPLELEPAEPLGPLTAMGWEIEPSGLRDLLERLGRDYPPLPIYITENGAAFDDPEPNGHEVVDDP